MDFQKHKTTIRKDPITGFGAKFVGPEDVVDEGFASSEGIFVGAVEPAGAAALAGLVTAMRVSSINGADASKMTRSQALSLLGSAGASLEVEVQYDPTGYACIDWGAELRRISIYAYQWEFGSELTELGGRSAVYKGADAVASTVDAAALDGHISTAVAKLEKKPNATASFLKGVSLNMVLGQ